MSAWTGIACSCAFTVWAVLTKGVAPLVNLGSWNYGGDDLTIGAVGNIVLFGAGFAVTLFAP